MINHDWTGWPGATCKRCGIGDPREEALADGADPENAALVPMPPCVAPHDLEILRCRPGTQVNVPDVAVRIKHLPTNIIVYCNTERSWQANKREALRGLQARLRLREKAR